MRPTLFRFLAQKNSHPSSFYSTFLTYLLGFLLSVARIDCLCKLTGGGEVEPKKSTAKKRGASFTVFVLRFVCINRLHGERHFFYSFWSLKGNQHGSLLSVRLVMVLKFVI
jgi:hypothetical protein